MVNWDLKKMKHKCGSILLVMTHTRDRFIFLEEANFWSNGQASLR